MRGAISRDQIFLRGNYHGGDFFWGGNIREPLQWCLSLCKTTFNPNISRCKSHSADLSRPCRLWYTRPTWVIIAFLRKANRPICIFLYKNCSEIICFTLKDKSIHSYDGRTLETYYLYMLLVMSLPVTKQWMKQELKLLHVKTRNYLH